MKILRLMHKSVLLHEAVDGLNLKDGDIYVDGTLGGGGHAEEIAKRCGSEVKIIGFDLDAEAKNRAESKLHTLNADFIFVESNYADITSKLAEIGIEKVNGILLDLGLSSFQLDSSGRGFSFQKDEPLLMTFAIEGRKVEFTARDIVNTWDEENIADIIYGYGEEQFSRRIARGIVEARQQKVIETTKELADIVKNSTPFFYQHRKTHPATKTFQALRITVNNELESLKKGLKDSFEILALSGRLAVISFHSLEDRIVKQFFKEKEKNKEGRNIFKKPIVPTFEEIKENPRSRSAKLRIVEKYNESEH